MKLMARMGEMTTPNSTPTSSWAWSAEKLAWCLQDEILQVLGDCQALSTSRCAWIFKHPKINFPLLHKPASISLTMYTCGIIVWLGWSSVELKPWRRDICAHGKCQAGPQKNKGFGASNNRDTMFRHLLTFRFASLPFFHTLSWASLRDGCSSIS